MTDLYGAIYQAILPFKDDIQKSFKYEIDEFFIKESVDKIVCSICLSKTQSYINERVRDLINDLIKYKFQSFFHEMCDKIPETLNSTIGDCINKSIAKYKNEIESLFYKYVEKEFKRGAIKSRIFTNISNINNEINKQSCSIDKQLEKISSRIAYLEDYIVRPKDRYPC